MRFPVGLPSIAIIALTLAGCQVSLHGRGPWSSRQIEAMRAEGFTPTARGWELSVNDRLLFPTDESRVDPDKAKTVSRMAAHLRAVSIRHAMIEGHADWTGSAQHNQALSKQRADAVADVFASVGFARSDLRTEGLGERYPIEDNTTASGRRENRRVVILLTAP